jgi:hypothetical protein
MLKKIQATLLDIENKDQNSNPYYKLSLVNLPATYFYAFSDLPKKTLTLLKETPHKLVNQLVLITYEELPKTGIFQKYKIKSIEFRGS